MSDRSQPKVSIAIPIFNEEKNIPSFLSRLLPVMESLECPYEVVFVDDGSRDGSLELLKNAAEKDPNHIRVIELSRNFGQHPALLAAFRFVTGEHIITLGAICRIPPKRYQRSSRNCWEDMTSSAESG